MPRPLDDRTIEHALTRTGLQPRHRVYPAIANVAGKRDEALELFHQTAEADIAVDTVQRALLHDDESTFTSTVAALTSAIGEHVQIEETQVFPLLESVPPAEVRELAQQILAFRQTITTPQVVG